MMHHSYQHLIFILPIKPFEFNHVIHQLNQYHQHSKSPVSILKNNKNQITIKLDNDHHFYLHHNYDKHVATETQQIIQDHVFDKDYSGSPPSPKQKLLLNQATERLKFMVILMKTWRILKKCYLFYIKLNKVLMWLF